MEPAGAGIVTAAGHLILHFVGILKIGVKTGPDIMGTLEPVGINVVIPFGITVCEGLKRVGAAHSREAVDNEPGHAALFALPVWGEARGVQARNRQQGPAEILILIRLVGPQIAAVIAEIGVEKHVGAEGVTGRNGSVEYVCSAGPRGSIAGANPGAPEQAEDLRIIPGTPGESEAGEHGQFARRIPGDFSIPLIAP